jgi:hypothetical protein
LDSGEGVARNATGTRYRGAGKEARELTHVVSPVSSVAR